MDEITECNWSEQHSETSEEIDWINTEAFKELVLIVLITILSFILVESLELVETLSNLAQKHKEWHITEIITVPVILSFAFCFYALRRWKELREKNRELRIAERKLYDMAAMAKAASNTKSQFLANMSHEIRTLTNAIVGFSDLLASEDLTNEQREYIDIISESANSLLRLINDILDLSKIEAGKLDIEIIDTPLTRLLVSIHSMIEPIANKKGLDFQIIKADGLPAQIRTDPNRLRQCLINLVGNAIKFTSEGHIYVKVSLQENKGEPFIRFDVEDTGIGVHPDNSLTIFDAFAQADGSIAHKFGGTGLGLAITKQLAKLLGGEVSMTSRVGEGSVFSLLIPAGLNGQKQPFLDKDDIAQHLTKSKNATEQTHFLGNVLVAEDTKSNQMLIKTLLNKMGLHVTIAEDGNKTVQKALTGSFDLIFMDINMPNMNGYEATQTLRKEGITTPVIALTANAMKGDNKKCIEAGCDGYLSKPLDFRELLETIGKYLSSKEPALNVVDRT
jgi:signal transduction histidine kinase/CheY-like chemotaxis protein